MKKIRTLLLLTFFLPPVFSAAQLPDSLKACLDSAILHAQYISLYRNGVNWDDVRELAGGFFGNRAGYASGIAVYPGVDT